MLKAYEREKANLLIATKFRPVISGVEIDVARLCERLLFELDLSRTNTLIMGRELERRVEHDVATGRADL